jgi:ABC-type transport system involved in cytochrome c biogenesis permease subunit
LVSWLAFLGYLHFRGRYGGRYARLNAALVAVGVVFILITLLWANLSKIFAGLHSYA